MRTAIFSTLCLAIFAIIQTGCLLTHSHHTVVRQGEPLRPLTFESAEARETFEAVAEDSAENNSDESRSSFGIPFIVGLEKSSKTSSTAIRNDVATRFDINSDQHISDYEASLQRR